MPEDLDLFLKETPEAPAVEPEATPAPEPAAETVEAKAEPEKGETGAPPAPELPPRGEDGKFKKRDSDAHLVPLEALLAERERRREAERKAEERKEQQPKPNFWDDPEGAVQAAIAAEREKLEREVDERGRRAAREQFFVYAENAAKSRYSDYEESRAAFEEEAKKNPVLVTQLQEAPDPAEFIYKQGKMASELRSVGGDLSAYRKRIEADVRQQVEREYAEKKARLANLPQSLNAEPSKGAGIKGGSWAGPTPLEDILPQR